MRLYLDTVFEVLFVRVFVQAVPSGDSCWHVVGVAALGEMPPGTLASGDEDGGGEASRPTLQSPQRDNTNRRAERFAPKPAQTKKQKPY